MVRGEGNVVEQVESQSRYRSVSGGGRTRKIYRMGIDPIASGLDCRAYMDLRGLLDPASGFLREQISGFHDLLRQTPTSLFICCDGSQFQWPP
jgi:hypothetical protein